MIVENSAERFTLAPGMVLTMQPLTAGATATAGAVSGEVFDPAAASFFAAATVGPFARQTVVSVTSRGGSTQVSVNAQPDAAMQLWAAAKVSGMSAIAKAMMALHGGAALPPPAKITPARITGNTRYCDPTWGGPFNGTFEQPYNAPSQATLAAGDGLLFKFGTTTTVASHIFPAVTGTSAAPIIYGVYDPTTGERLVNVVGGATIISTESTGSVFIFGANKDYICVDGLRLKAAAVNTFGVVDSNGGLYSQITNCEIYEGGFAGIRVYGLGHVIQGNTIRNNGGAGVYIYQTGNIPSNATVTYNVIRGNAVGGVYAYDGDGAAGYSGTVACNVLTDNGGTTEGRCGVSLLNGGGAVKIYRNVIKRSPAGVGLDGAGASQRDFSGALVENNDIADCGEFGVSTSNARGQATIQLNRIVSTGSFDGGATQGSSRGYGRSIELYGVDAARATSDFIVRWNFISKAFCWLGDGSEGVGIGLDDQTRNCDVYGNWVELCEGNGVQVNRGFGNRVFSNVLVDNVAAPPARNTNFFNALGAQIFYIGTPHLQVFNNTLMLTGRNPSQHQRYGIAEIDAVLSRSAKVFNNLIIGAPYAGIAKTTNAAGTVESSNCVIDAPRLVVNCNTLAGISADAATDFVAADDISAGELVPGARPSGSLDAQGVGVPAGCMSFAGQDLSINTPIGALHAAALI